MKTNICKVPFWKLGSMVMVIILGAVAFVFASEGGGHGGEAALSGAKLWDFLWRSLNFALLLAILITLLRKPLKSALNQRSENIRLELEALENKKAELQGEVVLYEQKLAQAKEERERITQEYREDGEKEKEKIIQNARAMEHRIREQSRLTIQQELKKAKESLRNDLAEESARLAEALLKKHIKDTDQHVLIGEYLTKVVKH